MIAPAPHTWHDANQQVLSAAIAVVRERLRAALAEDDPTVVHAALDAAAARLADAEAALPSPSALDQVCATFGLSPFERDLLLWCAGLELDSTLAPLTARLHGEAPSAGPTFGLALSLLPDAHWSALPPSAALRRWRLLELNAGPSLVHSTLRIDERMLHYLTGTAHEDEHLIGYVQPAGGVPVEPAPGGLVPSHQALVDQMVHWWSAPAAGYGAGQPLPVLQIDGRDAVAMRAVAQAACQALGLRLSLLAADVLPAAPHDFDLLARLWAREAALTGCALLIEGTDTADLPRLARFVDRVHTPLLVAGPRLHLPVARTTHALAVGRPTTDEQRHRWLDRLGPLAPTTNGQVDHLTAQFDLSAAAIDTACLDVRARLNGRAPTAHQIGEALWTACRRQTRPQLARLGKQIEPVASWDDLVLPPPQYEVLRDIARQVRHRSQVYDQWGFAARSPRGLGISALFYGPSGTGKTLAAEVVAHALGLDLFHIDLSQVVSKYIGETEKNLARVFDAAEQGGAVLLFDEADALFGKRTEVKDSHDRYANIEVSYLLQRMEAYRGLAILTSNMKSGIDEAFLRRLRFTISFPFPKLEQRRQIWQRIFPAQTPTTGLAFENLARLNVTGGNIRNIALSAAFLAADAGEAVGMQHLLQAARSEYVKLEKPLTDPEIRGWS